MPFPSLNLSVEIEKPDGTTFYRYDGSQYAPAAEIPVNISFSTKRMEGFERGSFILRRRIDLEWPDIELFDTVRFIAPDASIVYEGRVAAMPRSLDADGHQILVECVGWMAHARDRKLSEVYVDADLSSWEQPTLARQAGLRTSNFAIDPFSIVAGVGSTHASALVLRTEGSWVSPFKRVSEALYVFPEGSSGFGAVYFWSLLSQAGSSWTHQFGTSADGNYAVPFEQSGNFGAADTAGYWAPATVSNRGQRYGHVHWYFNATPAGSVGADFSNSLRLLRVYGNHGLTLQGENPKGYFVSDMIRDICERWCPELDPSGIDATDYPVPHAAFRERVHPYDAWLTLNSYHLWELAVWEGRKLHYSQIDATDYDWEVRLDDPGVSINLQGDSTEDLANGIVVEYTNVLTGQRDVLTPDDAPELADASADNPANKAGLDVWTEISLSYPSDAAGAAQVGRAALAEFNQAKAPGTITVTGHVRDRTGNFRPAWEVRAADTISVTNHPNDRARVVSETSFDQTSKVLSVSVDTTAKYLDAFFDRVATALQAANISA